MRDIFKSTEAFKEPTRKMSVLFLIFLLCGLYLGRTSIANNIDEGQSVIVSSDVSYLKLYLQSFALHLLVFFVFIKGYQSNIFIPKAYILSALIPALCGINIGRLLAAAGFVGLSAGIVSYMPHYIILFILYRKILDKALSGDILLTTDYTKYVIILSVISAVHVFVSGTLSGMLVLN